MSSMTGPDGKQTFTKLFYFFINFLFLFTFIQLHEAYVLFH